MSIDYQIGILNAKDTRKLSRLIILFNVKHLKIDEMRNFEYEKNLNFSRGLFTYHVQNLAVLSTK